MSDPPCPEWWEDEDVESEARLSPIAPPQFHDALTDLQQKIAAEFFLDRSVLSAHPVPVYDDSSNLRATIALLERCVFDRSIDVLREDAASKYFFWLGAEALA